MKKMINLSSDFVLCLTKTCKDSSSGKEQEKIKISKYFEQIINTINPLILYEPYSRTLQYPNLVVIFFTASSSGNIADYDITFNLPFKLN